ncbi:uncharacterized protein OCT59_001404 [Rhizophagus irregularis]|uniref:Uncharacterized protein n=2 Tax=Rhizophagus irregularis TaxID=588596 RepID=A0A2H5U795_RHIID|nr:hypothetical protein GLOIN_2v1873035 [Rhizophagus irregularis DAOM 181602=DAOM 197198]POG75249.1 hypothetical protein GLOIN_2v1873035 [Rhizophagus irregularis DAOM 181602=DAOM 197198]UZO00150.1 hypothetical protein OCT59_001404 [Rhizophagus irregularis]|eukprot:XP_025182115.1 hypothetical protein GLOIN_2v1873035 [Rhizophagus irregularis DAOM 181602=DAOM 197198]
MLLAKYECTNENEFKILLRSLIIGLIIVSERSDLILGINEKIKNWLFDFMTNLSNRKKIDSEFYLELLFIEKLLDNNNIVLKEHEVKEYKKLVEKKKKAREILKDKNIIQMMNYKIDIIDEAFVNEYNLIWNKKIVLGGYRNWRKKVTDVIWKNKILNSEKLDDLFMYNFRKEFDWETTLKFISNRSIFTSRQCNQKDTYDRSYRIKNILKELPTYDTLLKRNTNRIDNDLCKRCNKNEKETWKHIWICEGNEVMIDEVAQKAIYRFKKILETNDQQDEIKISILIS